MATRLTSSFWPTRSNFNLLIFLSRSFISLSLRLSSMIKPDNADDDSIIPYDGYKFMCINTYKDVNKISITNGKWYDVDTDVKHYDFNYNNYFKFDTLINLEKNRLNNKSGALGANLYNNELRGPSCYNFANNTETFELVEFKLIEQEEISKLVLL